MWMRFINYKPVKTSYLMLTCTWERETMGACSRSLYALRVLRVHGLPPAVLHEVARATTLAHLLYTSPAWWGFAKQVDRSRLERLLTRMRRMGYLPSCTPDVFDLAHAAEQRLLGSVAVNSNHVLRPLLPWSTDSGSNPMTLAHHPKTTIIWYNVFLNNAQH